MQRQSTYFSMHTSVQATENRITITLPRAEVAGLAISEEEWALIYQHRYQLRNPQIVMPDIQRYP